jgi:cell division protein FtsI (penicillin-binding protein 3)
VGTITIDEKRIGQTNLQKRIQRDGFGTKTGVDLPGEEPGRVLPRSQWYGTAILNVPIGEGIAVTPLQMAALYGAIANNGTWIQPHVTESINHKLVTGWKKRQLVSPAVAKELRGMLTGVVTGGTGEAAQIPGYTVAGKTGTTPKYNAKNGTYCDPNVNAKCQYQTSFVGFAPARHPRFVALVMVDQPQSKNGGQDLLEGGTVAAPVFKTIAQGILQVLQIPPDVPGKASN